MGALLNCIIIGYTNALHAIIDTIAERDMGARKSKKYKIFKITPPMK